MLDGLARDAMMSITCTALAAAGNSYSPSLQRAAAASYLGGDLEGQRMPDHPIIGEQVGDPGRCRYAAG